MDQVVLECLNHWFHHINSVLQSWEPKGTIPNAMFSQRKQKFLINHHHLLIRTAISLGFHRAFLQGGCWMLGCDSHDAGYPAPSWRWKLKNDAFQKESPTPFFGAILKTMLYRNLVGGWTKPFKTYARHIGSFPPNRDEQKKMKPLLF